MRQPGADIALDEPFLNGPRRFVTSFEKTFWGEKGARDENHGEAQGPRSKPDLPKGDMQSFSMGKRLVVLALRSPAAASVLACFNRVARLGSESLSNLAKVHQSPCPLQF